MAFQQPPGVLSHIAESPQLFNSPDQLLDAAVQPKRQRTEGDVKSTDIGLEMRKLVVSTCRSIINVEYTLDKQQKKLRSLEEHVTLGTVPKELLLPKKKALFEDEQSKVDGILHTACQSLLRHRIHETARKIQETHSKKRSLEQKMFSTFDSAREAQIKALSDDANPKALATIESRHAANFEFFQAQLSIARENAFIKASKEAEKSEKKKLQEAAMDTAPELRVEEVIDQRLRQLGILEERKPRPKSKSKRSKSSPSSSPANSTSSTRSSSKPKSRSRSPKGILKSSKRKVKFEQSKTTPKNGKPTTLQNKRGRGRGRGRGKF